MEASVEQIVASISNSVIVLAGDLNSPPEKRTRGENWLNTDSQPTKPTRENNCLDRIYVSEPISSQLTMNEHVQHPTRLLCKNNIRITSSPSARHELRLHLRGLPFYCQIGICKMQVQLGRASAPYVTSTNWTNLLTDANVSITAIRPLHVSPNSWITLTNLCSKL